MNQELPSLRAPATRSLSWFDTWIRAVTKPSVANFEEIARDPGASLGRAYLWVALASIISSLISTLVITLQGTFSSLMSEQMGEGVGGILFGSSIGTILCGVPILVIVGLIGFTIITGVIQLIAKLLGGVGTFTATAYVVSAIGFSLGIVTSLLTLLNIIPFLACLTAPILIALGIYGIALQVIAVKAVHQFGWGSAVISVLGLVILLAILGACVAAVVVAGLATLAPSIGNVFSNVLEGLVTPIPPY